MILKRFNVEKNVTEEEVINRLKAEGYVEVEEPVPPQPLLSLDGLTKAELVEMAKSRGVKSPTSLKKDELIKVLQ